MVKAGERGLELSHAPSSISQMLRASLMRPGTAGEISDTLGTMANDPEAKVKMGRLQATADALRAQKGVSNLVGGATAGGAAIAGSGSPMQGQQ